MGRKIEDYLEEFYTFTAKASDVSRQLALAGIAIIWIFKNPDGSDKVIPQELTKPTFFLVSSLGVDLIQYLVGAIIWGLFFEYKEWQVNKKKVENKNITAPNLFSWTITSLFFIKIALMLTAYIYLFDFLKNKI